MSGWRVRGVDYELSLPVYALVGAPRWVVEDAAEPPLPLGKAAGLAHRALITEFTDAPAWRIGSISVETYPGTVQDVTSPIQDRRYYQIGFAPPEYKGPSEDLYTVWVLMDGTVVMPHPRKELGVEPGTAPNAAPPQW